MVKDVKFEFTLNDCMFGAVKLTKIADPDKYSCIGFDSCLHFTPQNFVLEKSLVFRIENSHQFILIKRKKIS